jgi:hypothetical protein
MLLKEKMDRGIEAIEIKLALAKQERNYNRKVSLLRQVSELTHDYSEYWDEKLQSLME